MLNEKAHVIFALLNESYRIAAEEELSTLSLNTAPHASKKDFTRIFNALKSASSDIIDEIEEEPTASATDLKQILRF